MRDNSDLLRIAASLGAGGIITWGISGAGGIYPWILLAVIMAFLVYDLADVIRKSIPRKQGLKKFSVTLVSIREEETFTLVVVADNGNEALLKARSAIPSPSRTYWRVSSIQEHANNDSFN